MTDDQALHLYIVSASTFSINDRLGDDFAVCPAPGRLYIVAELERGPGWDAGYIDLDGGEFIPIPARPAAVRVDYAAVEMPTGWKP